MNNSIKGLFSLFETAKMNGLKYPKIRIETENAMLILSQAGNKSTFPGSINMASPGSFGENQFYGRIFIDGKIEFSKYTTTESMRSKFSDAITSFGLAPAQQAGLQGKATGSCAFCGITLTNCKSLVVGYGPICAEKYNLPYGDVQLDKKQMKLDIVDEIAHSVADGNLTNQLFAVVSAAMQDTRKGISASDLHYKNQIAEILASEKESI